VNIGTLLIRLEALEKIVEALEKENAFLRERLAKYENPKNSRNSSIPPSRAENCHKNNCSSSLQNSPPIKGKSRQIINIPPIKAIDTEYQNFSKVCDISNNKATGTR